MTDKTPNEMVVGAAAIADYIGFSERQAKWLIEKGELPTFKIGRHVCALKSKVDEWILKKADEGAAQ